MSNDKQEPLRLSQSIQKEDALLQSSQTDNAEANGAEVHQVSDRKVSQAPPADDADAQPLSQSSATLNRKSVISRGTARISLLSAQLESQIKRARQLLDEDSDYLSIDSQRPVQLEEREDLSLRKNLKESSHDEEKVMGFIYEVIKTCVNRSNSASLAAIEAIQNLVKDAEKENESLANEMAFLESDLARSRNINTHLSSQLREAEAISKNAIEALDALQRQKEDLERSKQALIDLRDKEKNEASKSSEISITEKEEELARLYARNSSLLKEKETLELKLRDATEGKRLGEEQRDAATSALSSLEERLAKVEKDSQRKSSKIEELQTEKSRLEAELARVSAEFEAAKSAHFDQIEQMNARLPAKQSMLKFAPNDSALIGSGRLMTLEVDEEYFRGKTEAANLQDSEIRATTQHSDETKRLLRALSEKTELVSKLEKLLEENELAFLETKLGLLNDLIARDELNVRLSQRLRRLGKKVNAYEQAVKEFNSRFAAVDK